MVAWTWLARAPKNSFVGSFEGEPFHRVCRLESRHVKQFQFRSHAICTFRKLKAENWVQRLSWVISFFSSLFLHVRWMYYIASHRSEFHGIRKRLQNSMSKQLIDVLYYRHRRRCLFYVHKIEMHLVVANFVTTFCFHSLRRSSLRRTHVSFNYYYCNG